MNRAQDGGLRFFSELSEHQISADEFFNVVLLDSLARNFGLKNVLISYFDPQGRFLSWTHRNGVLADHEGHPYRSCLPEDVVRQTLYREAVQDNLTYYNVTPRLYHSTRLIPPQDYARSRYVQFIQEQFGAYYSVTMAFGINAYIQVAFFKSCAEGDFTPEELLQLEQIYVYIANDYKNFKKYEQARIITNIQSEIILSGEKAYLVTDDFMHIMSCNHAAKVCLDDILGAAAEGLDGSRPCSWLPFLLGSERDHAENRVQTRVIRDYIFKIYTYDQRYSNGIVDHHFPGGVVGGERPERRSSACRHRSAADQSGAAGGTAAGKGADLSGRSRPAGGKLPYSQEACAEYLPEMRGQFPVPALPLDGAERPPKMTQRIQNGTPWEKAGQNVGNDDPVRLFSVDPQAQNRESSLFKIDRSSTVSPRRHLVESKQKQMQKQTQKKGGVRCGSDRHRVQCPALHHPRRPRGADRVFSEGMPPAVPVVLQPRKLGAAAAGGGLSDQVHRAQGLRCLR